MVVLLTSFSLGNVVTLPISLVADTEEGEVGLAVVVYLLVQYVTTVATAVALFAADLLWIDTVDHHGLRGGIHLLGVGAHQSHVHL